MTRAYRPTRRSGFWKAVGSVGFRVVFVVVSLGIGLTQITQAVRFPRSRTIAYADLARGQPADGWYRITGATLDYDRAIDEYQQIVRGTGLMRQSHHVEHVWLLRRQGGSSTMTHVTTDVPLDDPSGKVFAVVEGLESSFRIDRVQRTVEGTVASLSEEDTYAFRLPSEYRDRLAPRHLVIKAGSRPNLWLGIPLTAIGTLFGYWFLLDLRNWWRTRRGAPQA